MQKITPFLWFDRNAEEAMRFYVSVFDASRLVTITRYGEGAPLPAGTAMTVSVLLAGQEFVALNGGPHFTFSPAISFVVKCETQEEVDHFWEKLSEGGEQQQCGWLRDRYGVSWQIVPAVLGTMLGDVEPGRSQRVMTALLRMGKLDIQVLERAFRGA